MYFPIEEMARHHQNKGFGPFDLCTDAVNQSTFHQREALKYLLLLWAWLDKIVEVQQDCQFNRFLLCFFFKLQGKTGCG